MLEFKNSLLLSLVDELINNTLKDDILPVLIQDVVDKLKYEKIDNMSNRGNYLDFQSSNDLISENARNLLVKIESRGKEYESDILFSDDYLTNEMLPRQSQNPKSQQLSNRNFKYSNNSNQVNLRKF